MSNPDIAKKLRRNDAGSLGVFVPTIVVLAVLLAAVVALAHVWTDVQWYSQLNAARVFWTQWGWAIALGAVATLIVAAVVAANYWVARAGMRSADQGPDATAEGRKFARDHKWVVGILVPLLVGVIFGSNLASQWRTFLLWVHGTPFGQTDAQFGKDVSFYVFSLPAYQQLSSFFLGLIVISAVVAFISHYVFGGLSFAAGKGLKMSTRARVHFGVLAAFVALQTALELWLSRYDMLLDDNGKFSGASFTAINASLPGRTILVIVAVLVGFLFVAAAAKGLWKTAGIGVAVALVAGLVVNTVYPYFVQRFEVVPNAVEKESPYIQRNIDATLKAYGLDDVETSEYSAKTEAQAGQLREDAEATAQIRVLDPNQVSATFVQLQRNRQYYTFDHQLAVDRYTINGEARDTVISVRELDLSGLSDAQRTWVNDHTVYTHGYGVVAAYGNTTTSDGEPAFFQQGIPSTGELGEYEPRVYFGKQSPEYSVVGAPEGTDPWELDYPESGTGNGQKSTTYSGDGGPSIGSTFAKLMYAVKFRDTDLFFSSRVTSESQILYDRDPAERVAKVAPYLTLDSRVYPAVVDTDGDESTPKRLVWIVDGYTTTNQYPYSARQSLKEATDTSGSAGISEFGTEPEQVNYIRNSVKGVVDAYDGSVTLYQWDSEDPIVSAWGKVFPGMLHPVSEMSGDLMSHMRYPEDLFKVQRTLLSRYHVTDASAFYSGGDFWDVPQEPTASNGQSELQPPYYLTLQMPGQESAEFSLSSSFILGGSSKQNVMTGFLAVDSEAGNEKGKVRDGYGKLRLLELPRDVTVPGPGQAENNFLTESKVSTTLNLLTQGGTQVIMGNLLTLPVGGGLLYVQPVYVQASAKGGSTSYPISQYVLTTFGKGSDIGFAPTLEEALNQTFGGDSGAKAGDASISGSKEATTPDVSGSDGKKSDEASGADGSKDSGTAAPAAPGSAKERLDKSLSEAQKAIEESNTAMKNGDWAAYGEAQKKLSSALEEAVKAQQEIDGK